MKTLLLRISFFGAMVYTVETYLNNLSIGLFVLSLLGVMVTYMIADNFLKLFVIKSNKTLFKKLKLEDMYYSLSKVSIDIIFILNIKPYIIPLEISNQAIFGVAAILVVEAMVLYVKAYIHVYIDQKSIFPIGSSN